MRVSHLSDEIAPGGAFARRSEERRQLRTAAKKLAVKDRVRRGAKEETLEIFVVSEPVESRIISTEQPHGTWKGQDGGAIHDGLGDHVGAPLHFRA